MANSLKKYYTITWGWLLSLPIYNGGQRIKEFKKEKRCVMDKTDHKIHVSCLTQREVHCQNLVITAGGSSVVFNGIIDDKDPGSYLIPFLDKVHNDILDKHIPEVEIDIHNLTYINSSGIKEIINWLLKIESLNSRKYSITFRCSRDSRWQGISIAMIQKIIPDRINREYV